jgi:hypothetical protein
MPVGPSPREWARKSRLDQGLSEFVEDAATLRDIETIVRAALRFESRSGWVERGQVCSDRPHQIHAENHTQSASLPTQRRHANRRENPAIGNGEQLTT